MKGTLKDDLEALRAGTAMPEEGTPKKKAAATPRKRKADAGGDGEASPTKKGRKKTVVEPEVEVEDDEEVLLGVKAEPKIEDEA